MEKIEEFAAGEAGGRAETGFDRIRQEDALLDVDVDGRRAFRMAHEDTVAGAQAAVGGAVRGGAFKGRPWVETAGEVGGGGEGLDVRT